MLMAFVAFLVELPAEHCRAAPRCFRSRPIQMPSQATPRTAARLPQPHSARAIGSKHDESESSLTAGEEAGVEDRDVFDAAQDGQLADLGHDVANAHMSFRDSVRSRQAIIGAGDSQTTCDRAARTLPASQVPATRAVSSRRSHVSPSTVHQNLIRG